MAATLKDALAILPTIEHSLKLEVVVIFLYDTHRESLYVRPADVISVNARILREEDNQEEDIYNPSRRVLKSLVIFIYNCGSTNKKIRGRKALEQGKCEVGVNFFWLSRGIFA